MRSETNGMNGQLNDVIKSLNDHRLVMHALHNRLHEFRHIDSLPMIADGVRQLNRTLIWSHVLTIGALSIFVVLLVLKDSPKAFHISPNGMSFGAVDTQSR